MINKGIKYFCNEDISLIENYEKAIADQNQTWHCHHRKEITTSRKELIKIGEYYNRPACELIFLTRSEHMALHNTLKFKGNKYMLGKHHSQEAKLKMSIAHQGKTTWNKGKHWPEETKRKISEAKKNPSEETRRKISLAGKGNKNMLGKHHSQEAKLKMSIAIKGRHWFNNGVIEVQAKSCPEGFVKGRLKRKTQIT